MNAPQPRTPTSLGGAPRSALPLPPPVQASAPTLAELALLHFAPDEADALAPPEVVWLAELRARHGVAARDLPGALARWRAQPPAADAWLQRLAAPLALGDAECLAAALAWTVEVDTLAARALAWLQAPLAELRPSVGFITALLAPGGTPAAAVAAELLDGLALASGLLCLVGGGGTVAGGRPLSDTALCMPLPIVAAAGGGRGGWPCCHWLACGHPTPDPPRAGALLPDAPLPGAPLSEPLPADPLPTAALARWLSAPAQDDDPPALLLRGHDLAATRAVAARLAAACGHRAVALQGDAPAGWVPWLLLHQAWPVLTDELAPGERRPLPHWPGWHGPLLVATGLEGHWAAPGWSWRECSLPLPDAAARSALWAAQGAPAGLAATLGAQRRLGAARIRALAQAARAAAGSAACTREHVAAAARHTRIDLGSLAQPLPEDVPDQALVLAPALRQELQRLLERCQLRDTLADGLGPAARTRYRPGVRALLVGASGTGKTLSAGWLATRLGWPLVRVDMAAVSSKYIGETEKNLAELFARAEQTEVVLLFDEADALFGRRTELKDAHDRYANQQTNYLLQRIEAFDGVALLTSNSRARFDPAFTRRLDAIIDFPAPGPEERRALWLAHLGAAHALDDGALNRLAAACELAGGHVRNVVLGARALSPRAAIAWPALQDALSAEYRKLGKSLPAALAGPR